jgi:glutamate-ammonia-ligase adenylyltransferase
MQGSEAASAAAQADREWEQWRDGLREQGLRIPAVPRFVAALKRVWEASDYVSQALQRQPEMLPALLEQGHLLGDYGPGELDRQLRDQLAQVGDEAALHAALRRFRRYQMVRIIWRDLAGWAPLDETLEDLTALADACIARTLELLHAWQVRELGEPLDADGRPQRLVVLGMGKLGARELNLSSDIDLIFAFPEHGPVRGRSHLTRHPTSEQFFHRLAQRLVQALDTPTVDGFVFRVDTRLRPFGDAGALVLSFDAMTDYYHSQAREWERYAMVKARAVTGEPDAVEQLMGVLRPFVYRRYLDFAAIESLRGLKRMIAKELARKGMADNIKLGPGGIREIEFIGQVFQIIRGGREPQLQVRAIQPVLRQLGEMGLLPDYVVRELADAYRFLRLVENRVQAWRDQQTHLLPEDAAGRLRLARSMGFSDWDGFLRRLDHHRGRVQGHFDKVFAAPRAEDEEEGPYAALWRRNLLSAEAESLLAEAGFEEPQKAMERLRRFRDSPACRSLGSRGGERLEQLMPLLLEAIAGCQAPDAALKRVLGLVAAIVRRTAYLALYAPLRHQELTAELETLLGSVEPEDQEQQMERLRQFAQSNMLRVAAADLVGAIPVMVVSDYLTEIAEVAVEAVLKQCRAHLIRRHGEPRGVLGDAGGFAVIGYGKLGGIELGYGSDLDLVFLHGNRDRNAMTGGARPLANDLFYARLGQRLIHMLGTRTASGILYEVDMRLRPDGSSGLLVSSLDAFAHYQAESAWTWEHQALLRARPVAGDPAVRSRFRAIRLEVLARERDADQLRGDVREMREKMRGQLDRSNPDRFDLKQGRGGIADIEFMVQYAVLRWAARYPDLLDWSDNIRHLQALSRHGLLPGRSADELADAYRSLRADYHRYGLRGEPGLVPETRLQEERRRVCRLWAQMMV